MTFGAKRSINLTLPHARPLCTPLPMLLSPAPTLARAHARNMSSDVVAATLRLSPSDANPVNAARLFAVESDAFERRVVSLVISLALVAIAANGGVPSPHRRCRGSATVVTICSNNACHQWTGWIG